MAKDKIDPTSLSDPHDEEQGQCYAPVENGNPVRERKKHIEDDNIPPGWVQVECDIGCHLRK